MLYPPNWGDTTPPTWLDCGLTRTTLGNKKNPGAVGSTGAQFNPSYRQGRNPMNATTLTTRRITIHAANGGLPRRTPGAGASPIIASIAKMMDENYQRNAGNK